VRNLHIDEVVEGDCRILFGCYLESDTVVMTHIRKAFLPKKYKTYIRVGISPNPTKIRKVTTDIVAKKGAALFDLYKQV